MKRTLTLFLSLLMVISVLTSVPVNVSATSVDDLVFTLSDDGTYYSVTDCDTNVTGELVIPDTYNGLPVTSIGDSAFYNCKSLKSILIPFNITTIGSSAFYNCTGLEKIYWNAKNIADFNSFTTVFYNVGVSGTGIELVFGDAVEKIPAYLFDNAYTSSVPNIKTITIGENVSSIGESAFSKCANLISFNVDENNKSFSSDNGVLFSKDKTLLIMCPQNKTEYTIPDSTTTIGKEAFYNCENLVSITISESVTNIGTNAFYNCTGLKKVYWNAKNVEDFYSTSKIFYNVGASGTGIEIVFGDTVEKIPAYLFYNSYTSSNSNVKTIEIGGHVKTIGESAFAGCSNIKSIFISDIVAWCNIDFKNYTSNPLYYAGNLYLNGVEAKNIVIPNGIIRINNYAFYNCGNLETFKMPNTVTNIGESAFSGCKNLYEISLSENLSYIYNSVFKDCTNLKSITIPDSVTSLESSAFSGCTNLESVTMSNNVTMIESSAFYNCINLSSIKISNRLNQIGDSAFEGCTSLKSITIPNSVTNLGNSVFRYCKNLLSIAIPNSVKTIGSYAFADCVSLTSVVIPNSVSHINSYAFKNCNNLTSITIPNSVTYISLGVFDGCSQQIVIKTGCSSYARDFAIKNNINVELLESEHSAGNWIIDTPATCSETGTKHKECADCGNIFETATIPATGHTSSDWIFDEYVTCTTGGSKHKECTVCGEVLETVTYPATGHTTGHWIVDSQPTASIPGSQHKECIDCGKVVETATIPQLKPATPKVATTNEIGGVQVTWNKVAGATKYVVYRRQGGYNTWVNVGTTTGNTLLDKNVKSGIFYVYSVRAYNSAGKYSDFVSANTNTRKFMATPKLTTIYNHVNGLAIKWNAVAGITKGYRVYRRGAGQTTWTYLGTTKNLYFIDNAVKNKSGEYFRYTVIADGGYHSKFDTTGLYLRRLANPTLTSAVSSKSGITVKWGAVKGTTGYYVYRKTANSTWTRVGTVGGTNNTTFLDKTAKKGTTYTYTVKAVYGATTSAYYSGISCKDKY